MGSKKHKKESKKKKHRSRSRSPLEGEERERKRHRKHKDRKKDRSPDVEEVPVDSHLVTDNGARSRSRSASRAPDDHDAHSRDYRAHDDVYRDTSRSQDSTSDSPAPAASSAQESLSVEETNRLRAKLGLKPLQIAETHAEDGKIKDDLGEFYHKPAANLAQQRKADKLRERLDERREKRQLENKLQTTLLAEASDDEDASAWVRKSRDIEKQKREAAKRAALLDEMDAEFGVGALVADEQRSERDKAYATQHLKGLRVAHDIDALPDESMTILTLADKELLAEDAEDVLVNVNIVDDEKYKKNILERKKARAGYQAYDEEAELEASLGFARPVLAKYDDEIDSGKADKRRGFFIGDDDALQAKRLKDMMRAERVAGGPDKRLESLQLPELRVASDYMEEHEVLAKFKKFKKKGKIRKKPKQEPIDVDEHEAGTAPLHTDDTEVKPEQYSSAAVADEEETEVDTELQAALARARRLRQAEAAASRVPKVEEILQQAEGEPDEADAAESVMVLDATAEFCRTLGDIPTYGQAGNRDQTAEIMDFEREETELEPEADDAAGAWSRVDVDSEQPPDLAAGSSAGLEAEPALGAGVAGALRLALSKGYLERAGAPPRPARPPPALSANYSIEDKTYGEDDKYGRRERGGGYCGPLSEFREKSGFRPSIKLEYVDDEGRPLCAKEAFRYLSHKFHGKGPGKNKQEKRIKKAQQEGLMKKMSSTDTPLNTLQMLQQKQKETHSPFVVLSGAKRDAPN
ncbi:U4/U6.U5 tri-snRNP-associated protein 1 [Maniola hyperantus]|uniref:U4/U6.U5 tri-snRNP-associated protein 1 n=1 Tax=Aphantopus hyperantus TaxID=2795564 RepID=UPI00156A4616|nr:U4/U6.U5 tri-snRNP-associated protein 1 [Maniola hyperantus]